MYAFAGEKLAEETLRSGCRAARTIAHLDGRCSMHLKGEKELAARVAISRVPDEVVGLTWKPLMRGRWRSADAIMLGEGRATWFLMEKLAADVRCRCHVVLSLMDNEAWSSATMKGRSAHHAINLLLRRLAALCESCEIDMLLPWMDTLRQPADGLSRLK